MNLFEMNVTVEMGPCPQQDGTADCGVFTITICTVLAHGSQPGQYDQKQMRGHLRRSSTSSTSNMSNVRSLLLLVMLFTSHRCLAVVLSLVIYEMLLANTLKREAIFSGQSYLNDDANPK